jgi:hypothetical protein
VVVGSILPPRPDNWMAIEHGSNRSRRAVRAVALGTTAILGVGLLAGCGSETPSLTGAASPAASLDAVPVTTPTAAPTVSAEQSVAILFEQCGPAPASLATDAFVMATDWGPIYCGVPADFPVWPRSEDYEAVDDPASAVWLATGDAGTVASWYRLALEEAGYRTASISSTEKPGQEITIESVGSTPECRLQVRFGWAPAGEEHPYAFVSARYGIGCPSP